MENLKKIKIISRPWVVQMTQTCYNEKRLAGIDYDRFENYSDFQENTAFISFMVEGGESAIMAITDKSFFFEVVDQDILRRDFYYGGKSNRVKTSGTEFRKIVNQSQEKSKKVEYNFVF